MHKFSKIQKRIAELNVFPLNTMFLPCLPEASQPDPNDDHDHVQRLERALRSEQARAALLQQEVRHAAALAIDVRHRDRTRLEMQWLLSPLIFFLSKKGRPQLWRQWCLCSRQFMDPGWVEGIFAKANF